MKERERERLKFEPLKCVNWSGEKRGNKRIETHTHSCTEEKREGENLRRTNDYKINKICLSKWDHPRVHGPTHYFLLFLCFYWKLV
jgi:hypothetical protein